MNCQLSKQCNILEMEDMYLIRVEEKKGLSIVQILKINQILKNWNLENRLVS